MYASLFHLVEENKEKSAQELLELLEVPAPGLFSVLEDDALLPGAHLKGIILYTIYAYSKESPYLVMGDMITFSRETVYQDLNLPDTLHESVVKLGNQTVRSLVLKYLERQGDRVFRHLIRKHELYEAMMDDQMLQLSELGDDGKLDTKKLVESSKMMDQLLVDISSLEVEMRKEYAFIFDNFKNINSEVKDGTKRQSLAIERHSLVK